MAVNVGYVRVWRSILESDVFQDDWLFRLWVWCILRANYRDQVFKGAPVPRGSFVTSMDRGAEALHVSKTKFWRGLKTLEKYGQIVTKTETKITVVTVCNYSTYQDDVWQSETDIGTKVEPSRNESETNLKQIEEGKKERKKEGKEGGAAVAAPAIVRAEDVPVPEQLNTPEFIAARDRWVARRRKKRWSVDPDHVATQYRKLIPLGVTKAIECLDYSTDNSYQTLCFDRFEPRKTKTAHAVYNPAAMPNGDPTHGKL